LSEISLKDPSSHPLSLTPKRGRSKFACRRAVWFPLLKPFIPIGPLVFFLADLLGLHFREMSPLRNIMNSLVPPFHYTPFLRVLRSEPVTCPDTLVTRYSAVSLFKQIQHSFFTTQVAKTGPPNPIGEPPISFGSFPPKDKTFLSSGRAPHAANSPDFRQSNRVPHSIIPLTFNFFGRKAVVPDIEKVDFCCIRRG